MKTYKLQGLYNIIYGFLKGTKTQPELDRTYSKIFLCDNCSGRGFFSKSKSDPYGEDCEVCEGTGRINLKFTVKRVPLDLKEY